MSDNEPVKVYDPLIKSELTLVSMHPNGVNGIYADLMQVLARQLKARIKKGYQNVIVCTGRTGAGKSTCMLNLIRAMDPEWQLGPNYIYSDEDLARKLKHKETANPISLFDEGSVSFNSLNYNKSSDKAMIVLLDCLRSLGYTTCICIPSINDLNKRIRDHLIDYLIVCPDEPLVSGYDKRGFFELYRPVSNTWSKGTYYQLLGAGLYSKLDRQLDDEYQRIKLEHQLTLINSFIDTSKDKKEKVKE